MRMIHRLRILYVSALLALGSGTTTQGAPLISDQFISEQISLTHVKTLKNGLPILFRELPESRLSHILVAFRSGVAQLPRGKKSLGLLTFDTMPYGSEKYSKQKIFELIEKYAFSLECASAVEMSFCRIGTVSHHFEKALDLLAAILLQPTFPEEDVKLGKERKIASYKSQLQSPDDSINDVVNQVYYEADHPYRLDAKEAISELGKFERKELVALHRELLNAEGMHIVVISGTPWQKNWPLLEKKFQGIPQKKITPQAIPTPQFSVEKSFYLEHRDIPTAFMRAKFNGPSYKSPDAVAARLLFDILNHELETEIRTKRSLSYAIHSSINMMNIGIGNLYASTSKPEETLKAMNEVLHKFKNRVYTAAELEEYKTVFTTAFYLTMESHGSLAHALAQSYHYLGQVNSFYEFPRRLSQVSPEDIHRLAQSILKDFRLGVLFSDKKFSPEWGTILNNQEKS